MMKHRIEEYQAAHKAVEEARKAFDEGNQSKWLPARDRLHEMLCQEGTRGLTIEEVNIMFPDAVEFLQSTGTDPTTNEDKKIMFCVDDGSLYMTLDGGVTACCRCMPDDWDDRDWPLRFCNDVEA